jgi:hypothetical protein
MEMTEKHYFQEVIEQMILYQSVHIKWASIHILFENLETSVKELWIKI